MHNTLRWTSFVLAVVAAVVVMPAQAQLLDFLKNLPAPSAGVPATSNSNEAALNAAAQSGSTSAAMVSDAPPVGPRKDIQAELRPDRECNRPQERFNIAEKLAEYGGAQAALRLRRLIESDFRFSDLKPEDRAMLTYLARTTVWVPVEVESKLGAIFVRGGSLFGGPTLNDMDKAALELIGERLNRLKATISEFPGDITLTVDKTLADGAFAKFGGVIVLSERFLTSAPESTEGTDFVLAHELSHIYKRHAVKELQFGLISSEEGWEIARKVLQRAQRGASVDPIADGLFFLTTVPKLIDFVRGMQIKYGRVQELEADACSVTWLRASGSEPMKAFNGYRATLGASKDEAGYASSHPGGPERETVFVSAATRRPGAPASPAPRAPGPQRRADTGKKGG